MTDPYPSDDCPCGSGRTLASCCERPLRADLAARREAQTRATDLIARIAVFAYARWGPRMFDAATYDFAHSSLSVESLEGLLSMFDPWFAFSWIPNRRDDLHPVPRDWPTRPIAREWLDAESNAVTPAERRLVRAAAKSPYYPLLVESCVPGWTVSARDLLTGRRFRLIDPEVSRRLEPEDVLLSSVLTLGRRSMLLATAAYALPSAWRVELREERLNLREAGWTRVGDWLGFEWEIFQGYRKIYERGPLCELETLGDARDPVHLSWRVAAPFSNLLERLTPLTACYGDCYALDAEDFPDGTPSMLLTWHEAFPGDRREWREIGYLYLNEGGLAADVPTPALADRLIAEVAARAGGVTALQDRCPCAIREIHDRRHALLLPQELTASRTTESFSVH